MFRVIPLLISHIKALCWKLRGLFLWSEAGAVIAECAERPVPAEDFFFYLSKIDGYLCIVQTEPETRMHVCVCGNSSNPEMPAGLWWVWLVDFPGIPKWTAWLSHFSRAQNIYFFLLLFVEPVLKPIHTAQKKRHFYRLLDYLSYIWNIAESSEQTVNSWSDAVMMHFCRFTLVPAKKGIFTFWIIEENSLWFLQALFIMISYKRRYGCVTSTSLCGSGSMFVIWLLLSN